MRIKPPLPAYISEGYSVNVLRHPATRVAIREIWEMNGRRHREGGPAEIHRHPETGMVLREWWYKDGLFHRDDGPAVVRLDAVTGRVMYSSWYEHGNKIAAKPNRPPPESAARTRLQVRKATEGKVAIRMRRRVIFCRRKARSYSFQSSEAQPVLTVQERQYCRFLMDRRSCSQRDDHEHFINSGHELPTD